MISLITKPISNCKLESIDRENDIFLGKIHALYQAYGMGGVCRFYTQDDRLLISVLGNDAVIAKLPNAKSTAEPFSDESAEELASFLYAGFVHVALLPSDIMRGLEPYFDCTHRYNHIMCCQDINIDGENPDNQANGQVSAKMDDNPDLDDVYKIIDGNFPVEYTSWMADLSHRIRHGISKVYLFDGVSTATALYETADMVFLTQVATLESARGQGIASRMLKDICTEYHRRGQSVWLVCRESKRKFYERIGFKKVGDAVNIYSVDS
jgi:ribosomal protein S18 acetylase RimI-like enzyme